MPAEYFSTRIAADNFRTIKMFQGIKPNDIIIQKHADGNYYVIWETRKRFKLFGA